MGVGEAERPIAVRIVAGILRVVFALLLFILVLLLILRGLAAWREGDAVPPKGTATFQTPAGAVAARVTGPADGPPIVLVTILAAHRQVMPVWLVAAVTSLAVLSPWLFSLAGVIGPQISVSGGTLILHTAADHLDGTAAVIGLAIYIVAGAQLAALLGRLQDDARRDVRRAIQIQAWQLRQLLPRATTGPVA